MAQVRVPPRAWAFLFISPAVLVAVLWLSRRAATSPGDPSGYWDDDLRREVQAIVERRYVDPIPEEEARRLFHGALRGYVGELDPYSRFVPPEERPEVDRETEGAFGGVGVRVQAVPDGLRVTAVRKDGPAERAGIEPGEVLTRVAETNLSGKGLDQMLDLIRGEPGTDVEFTVGRNGSTRKVRVERAVVPLDTVPAVRLLAGDPPVGYVRIEQFSETTSADVREAFAGLRRDGARALVVDLRQNLGGVVRSAVDVAGLLLPEGARVSVSRRREGGEVYTAAAPDGAAAADVPVAVLVDAGTASASEILAGALQDHGRAVLVGERTWGKFLVQTQIETSDGRSMVRLTTARYETPRGRSAPRDAEGSAAGGLMPDVRVPMRATRDREALQRLFARQAGPHWRSVEETEPEPADAQLDCAVALLRGGASPSEPVPPRPR